ncbi:MAG: rhodanese-like domain-containing protein [Oscillospiraceae bacterium]|jgi:rhodanese-related sulfurtransferase|nr:rhodanese-like domain-containing protein [Oscillospiraceae bacterium]
MKFRAVIFTLAVIVCAALVFFVNSRGIDHSLVTGVAELRAAIDSADGNTLFLDLRKNSDYELSHIEGAVNVPYKDNDNGEGFLGYIKDNNIKNRDIYLYCYAGKKSAEVFNLLTGKGYRHVHSVSVGYSEYAEFAGNKTLEGTDICQPCKAKEEAEENENTNG